ncbi:FAD-dependent oxidoreductase [Flammeovirga sp. EKP202]|uniref:FAD-dependent oxidoreductase n=1 Tax=Flammeovirga sp. EKP202 TaxID=2770592 RepID=UPI00165EC1A8|nr:FAD-dependent oxidoreductase [Flammeovirga sp. EKP202]MBD0401512.1 FAD-dependent oxidoreductase [Flammeovirga sp. EKP202]
MKVLIIGSVAAGTSVAAKARRNNEEIEIVIYEKDSDISYSGCGLPYYIGEDYIQREDLTPRNPSWFKKRFNLDIKVLHEVLSVDHEKKEVSVKNLSSGEEFIDKYDKLVFATGASPIIPPIENLENDFTFMLRNVNQADKVSEFVEQNKPKNAVIIGAGYIGLELAENLKHIGIDVTIVERGSLPMPNLDKDVAVHIAKELRNNTVTFMGNESVKGIIYNDEEKLVQLESGKTIATDFVVVCVGVKPVTQLAQNIGVDIGYKGAISVDKFMQTNINDVYAVGDCALSYSAIDNNPIWVPLGSTANKMGRICGDHITGGTLSFQGILGTGIFKLFDLSVGMTGLTEQQAIEKDYNYVVHHNYKPNQSQYLKTSKEMMIKMLADKDTGKVLGAQIVGKNGVDKRVDVIATAITFGATAEQLFHLDLAYAPPFSTTKDPVHYSGMVLNNAIKGNNQIITPQQLNANRDEFVVIDVRANHQYESAHIEGAINIPLAKIREEYKTISKEQKVVVHCNKGVSGNAAQNILLNLGFKEVYNLSGGFKNYKNVASI